MARSGLRMMPPSPSPSLKFRTAGFPRYGFKASLSGRAFPNASAVKPAPGIPVCAPGLHRPFARFHDGRADPALCPDPAVLPRAAVRAALVPLYPRGPWLRSEFCCLGPSSRTPTPSASLAGTRRLHGPAAYTPRLRCTGAPRRPTRPSLLSLPSCPCVPSTLRRWVRGGLPVVHPPRCQTSSCYDRVATHECPSLPAIPDGVMDFGAASFASCCGPRVCPALLAGYDEMRSRAPHLAC